MGVTHVLTLFFLGRKSLSFIRFAIDLRTKKDVKSSCLEPCCPVELSVMKEMFCLCYLVWCYCVVLWPEYLKCGLRD